MPPADFSIDVAHRPGVLVVAPRGEIDMATVGRLREACASVYGTLVLDLRGVEFIDTSGLTLVIECQRRAEQDGTALALVPGPPHVQRLFDIAGLAPRLSFVDDPGEVPDGGGRSA